MKQERCISLVYRQEAIRKNGNIQKINRITTAFLSQYQRFKVLYPADDVRPWTFQKIAQILAYYRLSLCYSGGILSRTDNMGKILTSQFPESGREVRFSSDRAGLILVEYEQYLTFSFFHVVFSSFESSMRSIVGTVPIPNRKGKLCKETDKFSDIYHGLINYTGAGEHYRELFELLMMVRNCIHNRSVYFSDKGSKTVTYKNKAYDFIQGKHIDFATIEFFFELLMDIQMFFVEMYSSEQFVKETHIPDDVL